MAIYEGSDGEATKALFERLGLLGPAGTVAVKLFRAQKASARAKIYRGGRRGSWKRQAYDRKGWALDQLCGVLAEHGEALGIVWGWGVDEAQEAHRHVLYVDLPNGQVSFHSGWRGDGPFYLGAWDGQRGRSPSRICRYVADLLREAEVTG